MGATWATPIKNEMRIGFLRFKMGHALRGQGAIITCLHTVQVCWSRSATPNKERQALLIG